MRGLPRLIAVLLGTGLLAAGCGDDSTIGGDGAQEPAKSPPVYTIKASDPAPGQFKFDIPTGMSGGVITLRLQNDGRELHDFQLARPVEGHTLEDLLKQVESESAPLEPWVRAAGGVGSVAPGKSAEVTLGLPAGKYWFFSTESSGEGDDAVPDSRQGMAGELTLVGDSGATLPETSAVVTAKEYSLTLDGLKAGSNTVTFRNDGIMLHHALLFPVAQGKTFDDARQALTSDGPPSGPPPVDFERAVGTAVNDPKQRSVTSFDLQPGTYAVVCFLPDPGTAGPPHLTKGMITELKVA